MPIEVIPPTEAAFSWGEGDTSWFARITWKCSVCGRRNVVLDRGPGRMTPPIKVKCKNKHEAFVNPYHWNAELRRSV